VVYIDRKPAGTGVDTLIFLGPSVLACCDKTESVLKKFNWRPAAPRDLQLPEMGLFDMVYSVNCPYN
jgi:hypothetical protein